MVRDARNSTGSKKQLYRHLASLFLTLALASAASALASRSDHPVTASMVFVVAILANGAAGGLWAGLAAALVSAAVYSVFIRFPVYAAGFDAIDDYVPLAAFSVTALMSGLLSGRLTDKARAEQVARRRLHRILQFSGDLQSSITFDDIARALESAVPSKAAQTSILTRVRAEHGFRSAAAWDMAVAAAVAGDASEMAPLPPDGADRSGGDEGMDAEAIVQLLCMTIERCELLDERAQAAGAIQSEKLKTALLSSLSHDLRTPLSAISASADGLLQFGDRMDRGSQRQLIETIREQSRRLEEFTTKLLALSRLSAGLSDKDLELVDVEETMGSAIAAIRRTAPGRSITRRITSSSVLTRASPILLEQTLYNVLENAVRYSPDDTEVEVTLAVEDGVIVLTVSDHGIGIMAPDLSQVFERFYRGSRPPAVEGQGLGLSIAKAFVDSIGGEISVSSPAEGGFSTAVRIRLPLAAWHEPATADA